MATLSNVYFLQHRTHMSVLYCKYIEWLGLQIGVFGFNNEIIEGDLTCFFKLLQPGLTPIKMYLIKYLKQLVSDTAPAMYHMAVAHAVKKIEDIKKVKGSQSGMYVKCFIHVLPSNNTSKIVTNGCRTRADMSCMSSYIIHSCSQWNTISLGLDKEPGIMQA